MNGTTMDVGMLWFDDTPGRALTVMVQGAMDHYTDKFGSPPDVCFVHPSALTGERSLDDPIKILIATDVLPHHFWLGVDNGAGQQQPRAGRALRE